MFFESLKHFAYMATLKKVKETAKDPFIVIKGTQIPIAKYLSSY